MTFTNNWNLFHFDGNGKDVQHELWDVSLSAEGGTLSAYVFDFLRGTTRAVDVGARCPWARLSSSPSRTPYTSTMSPSPSHPERQVPILRL